MKISGVDRQFSFLSHNGWANERKSLKFNERVGRIRNNKEIVIALAARIDSLEVWISTLHVGFRNFIVIFIKNLNSYKVFRRSYVAGTEWPILIESLLTCPYSQLFMIIFNATRFNVCLIGSSIIYSKPNYVGGLGGSGPHHN